MGYTAFTVLIGSVHDVANRVDLHRHVASMISGIASAGGSESEEVIPVDYQTYVHSPGLIADPILRSLSTRPFNVDTIILDFTTAPGGVRDPVLLALALAFEQRGVAARYVLLMPELPGDQAASIREFIRIVANRSGIDTSFFLVANSGRMRVIDAEQNLEQLTPEPYAALVSALFGDPVARFDAKTVKRVGHFFRRKGDGHACTPFSYQVINAEREFDVLLRAWWTSYAGDSSHIVYDLASHHDLRNVVEAFAEERGISADRVQDLLQMDEAKQSIWTHGGPTVLIVDAVDSGETLLDYWSKLSDAGANLHPDVLTIINKSGSKESHVAGLSVHGLVHRPRGNSTMDCLQCVLKLPHTPDSFEPYMRIRTFDMLFLAREAGWAAEPELEVPHESGRQYLWLPNFAGMLAEHGDWIALKLLQLLSATHSPDQWFLVHPDEQDSAALVGAIQRLLESPIETIKVPRALIAGAQSKGYRWDLTEPELGPIAARLRNGSGAAYLLDIFNGSGGTLRAMTALLNACGVSPQGYFCLVDFDPGETRASPAEIPKLALYEWHYPRPDS